MASRKIAWQPCMLVEKLKSSLQVIKDFQNNPFVDNEHVGVDEEEKDLNDEIEDENREERDLEKCPRRIYASTTEDQMIVVVIAQCYLSMLLFLIFSCIRKKEGDECNMILGVVYMGRDFNNCLVTIDNHTGFLNGHRPYLFTSASIVYGHNW
ncbi:hypothetical protein ACJX0J_023898, partial [Zea mays]